MLNKRGFTIIEIMLVLIVLGILTILAVPAMRFYIQNSRAIVMTTDFTSALAFARSEALKRGTPVTICASNDTVNYNTCGASNTWSNGWIIFTDPNADGVIAASTDRLKIHQALPVGSSITTTQARITYNSTGFATAGSGTFTLMASGCTGNYGRLITISTTGRAHIDEIACT